MPRDETCASALSCEIGQLAEFENRIAECTGIRSPAVSIFIPCVTHDAGFEVMGKLKNIQGNFKTFRRRFDFFPVETLFSEHGHRDGAYTVACLFAEMRRNGGIDSGSPLNGSGFMKQTP